MATVSLSHYTISERASLRSAWKCIDSSGKGIALLVDEAQRLKGTLTDGDVRRALLNGAQLDDPALRHAHDEFIAASPEESRVQVLDMMQARRLSQIPVVSEDGELVGLHFFHELLGVEEKPNWAVIMCGGRGIRLHPMTENTPKPMIKVAGRPILERLVLHLVGYGFRRIYLAVNYLSHIIEGHFGDGSRFGCQVEYLREDEPMHTGGALSLLPDAPQHPTVVMNGDLVTQVDLGRMMDFHSFGEYQGTIGYRRYVQEVPFGCLDVDGGDLIQIKEKPAVENLVNAGVYVLSPELIATVPPRSFPITELFEFGLQNNVRLGAFEVEDEWLDVGHKEQLRRAREGG